MIRIARQLLLVGFVIVIASNVSAKENWKKNLETGLKSMITFSEIKDGFQVIKPGSILIIQRSGIVANIAKPLSMYTYNSVRNRQIDQAKLKSNSRLLQPGERVYAYGLKIRDNKITFIVVTVDPDGSQLYYESLIAFEFAKGYLANSNFEQIRQDIESVLALEKESKVAILKPQEPTVVPVSESSQEEGISVAESPTETNTPISTEPQKEISPEIKEKITAAQSAQELYIMGYKYEKTDVQAAVAAYNEILERFPDDEVALKVIDRLDQLEKNSSTDQVAPTTIPPASQEQKNTLPLPEYEGVYMISGSQLLELKPSEETGSISWDGVFSQVTNRIPANSEVHIITYGGKYGESAIGKTIGRYQINTTKNGLIMLKRTPIKGEEDMYLFKPETPLKRGTVYVLVVKGGGCSNFSGACYYPFVLQ